MLTDRYGNALTTASTEARDAYVEGVDRLLAGDGDVEGPLTVAVTADPAFALAQVAVARQHHLMARGRDAKDSIDAAVGLAASTTAREQRPHRDLRRPHREAGATFAGTHPRTSHRTPPRCLRRRPGQRGLRVDRLQWPSQPGPGATRSPRATRRSLRRRLVVSHRPRLRPRRSGTMGRRPSTGRARPRTPAHQLPRRAHPGPRALRGRRRRRCARLHERLDPRPGPRRRAPLSQLVAPRPLADGRRTRRRCLGGVSGPLPPRYHDQSVDQRVHRRRLLPVA